MSPSDGESGSENVIFSWECVEYASEYEIRIDTTQPGEAFAWFHDTLYDTSVTLVIPPGTIYWQVRPFAYGPCEDGVWTTPAAYTDAYTSDEETLPNAFSLKQNYPNPFNPSTDISFALPVATNVKLEIFNILGQKLITLIEQRLPAGNHTITWDGSDFASGVYLYRLKAGDFVETKKMMLIK